MTWIDQLAMRLAPGPGAQPPADDKRRAAVAIVLHDDPAGPRVLLMKRADRDGDPWSGHISLPGGGFHLTDLDLRTTAIRETVEELGIDCSNMRYLGQLPSLQPFKSGPAGVEVTPFVFASPDEPEPILGPEAVGAFWLSLALAGSGGLDAEYSYDARVTLPPLQTLKFPSWNYEGHVIWGLTWRILRDLLALMA